MSRHTDVEKRKIADRGLRRLSTSEWMSRRELFGGKQEWWQRKLLERLIEREILKVEKGRPSRFLLIDQAHLSQILDHEESLLMLVFPSYTSAAQLNLPPPEEPAPEKVSDSIEVPTEDESPEYSDAQIQQAQLRILMGIAQSTNEMIGAIGALVAKLDQFNSTAESILRELKG